MTSPSPHPADLHRALAAIRRTEARWLDDLRATVAGDPRFLDAFRRWQENLALLKVHLHRAEQRLLHYLLVPEHHRPWEDTRLPQPDRGAAHRHWQAVIPGYFHALHLETTYRRVGDLFDPWCEAVTADITTDLVAVAVTAETTLISLKAVADRRDEELEAIEDLAFYRVLSPWKRRGMVALVDVLRFLDAFLAERDEL